ncbi:MAG: hypothetical protein IPH72_15925 [Sandaracinaceae bacterium]|nr:hypothetical protein [Sandaracinaceae bacterium]
MGGALLALTNLSAIAQAWGQSSRMTVYLRDGAETEDVAQLRALVETLPEVSDVQLPPAKRPRAQFLEHSDVRPDWPRCPPSLPGLPRITAGRRHRRAALARIAERLAQFRAVSDVETYRGWFSRLEYLLRRRAIAGALAAGGPVRAGGHQQHHPPGRGAPPRRSKS